MLIIIVLFTTGETRSGGVAKLLRVIFSEISITPEVFLETREKVLLSITKPSIHYNFFNTSFDVFIERGRGGSIMSLHRVSDLGVNYRNYSSNFHHVITHRQRKCMIITLILLVKCNNFITLMRDSCLKGTLKCTQAGTNEPTKNELTKEERTNKRRGPRREG